MQSLMIDIIPEFLISQSKAVNFDDYFRLSSMKMDMAGSVGPTGNSSDLIPNSSRLVRAATGRNFDNVGPTSSALVSSSSRRPVTSTVVSNAFRDDEAEFSASSTLVRNALRNQQRDERDDEAASNSWMPLSSTIVQIQVISFASPAMNFAGLAQPSLVSGASVVASAVTAAPRQAISFTSSSVDF